MTPLIEIKSVPIEIEMKVSPAKLEYTRGTAELEISRSDSGVQIKSKPIRLNLDTFEPSNAVMPATHYGSSEQAVYQATATYAQQNDQLLINAKIAAQGNVPHVPAAADSVASAAPETMGAETGGDWNSTEMNIRYEMDKLNFDWRITQTQFEFTPGDIEISVTQQPDVVITYVGGPLYVPRSADPNYEPIDVQA